MVEEDEVVNPSGITERHIFFDDNIELDRAHIVDVRMTDGTPIPFRESNRRWIAKAEPWLAITCETYFIDLLDSMLEKNYT